MASDFQWHELDIETVAHELKTDIDQGLSNKEAFSRLERYGPNDLPVKTKLALSNIVLRQHISLMIPVFLIILLALVYVWRTEEDTSYLYSAIVVFGILVINVLLATLLSVIADKRCKKVMISSRESIYVKVIRNGHLTRVKSIDVVPGDIVILEMGDRVPADGRVIESNRLTVDESAVFGTQGSTSKSVASISQSVPVHNRNNMVFRGGMVVSGKGRYIVTATGQATQIAQKLGQLTLPEDNSMIKTEVSRNGIYYFIISIVLSSGVFVGLWLLEKRMINSLITGLAFMMALWPMGISEVISMAISNGLLRLKNSNIAVREPRNAELLSKVTVMCFNKEGIVTSDNMIAKKIFVDGRIIEAGSAEDEIEESSNFIGATQEETPDLDFLLTIACMTTSTQVRKDSEGWSIDGDSNEAEFVKTAIKAGINKDELSLSLTKLGEISYDNRRKRMSVIYEDTEGQIHVFTRGTLDSILKVSDSIQLHGHSRNLDSNMRIAIRAVNRSFADELIQSVAFAYRRLRTGLQEYTPSAVERDMTFVGMIGLFIPPRPNIETAVEKCLMGSIKLVMFTEDPQESALSFARKVGIAKSDSEVISSEDIGRLKEEEFQSICGRFSVISDVLHQHKAWIVRGLKKSGETTAMIGETVYDIVSIKEADIGISKGETSSPICVESSDLVLMDGGFPSAVSAVETVRTTYTNVKKIIRYFLSASLAMAITMLATWAISTFWKGSLQSPLSPIHILWLNTFGVILPSIAIAFRPTVDGDISDGNFRGSIIDGELKINVLLRGLLAAVFAIVAFMFAFGPERSWEPNAERACSAVITILLMTQLAFAFQCCSTSKGVFRKFISSKLLILISFIIIAFHLSIIYVPTLNEIFKTQPLSVADWIPITLSFIIFSLPFDELFSSYNGVEEQFSKEVSK